MKRIALGAALFAAAVVSFAACSDPSDDDYPSYGRGPVYGGCAQYETCGACTPVPGCGWCATAGGGFCSSDPYSCAQGAATWNWNPQGCRVGADAGVVGADGGATAADASDAATTDAASDGSLLSDAASDVTVR